ncbi:helix-turn-helix domain-containing protein [Zestomonas carbonaria]|uniref:helix-turn-helix domain-containing protein n=1 Tax=Zestomonas carbonaria TaxID=2762745 RepID=UPI0016572AFF|nr:helix-turn-helix domain-containing protein [Pseudomonas carbonaria]
MSIGARIKEERERLGYSQTQFAALVEVSKKTQIRWEQEGGAYPDAAQLAAWGELGLDLLYVLTGDRLSSNRAMSHDLPADEQLLLDEYRGRDQAGKKELLANALTGSAGKKPMKGDSGVAVEGDRNRTAGGDYHEANAPGRAAQKTSKPVGGVTVKGSGNRTAGRDYHETKE